ncbi:hypothetical protein JMUB6875_28910 [Nocardia sp. JMUB6875]|uniref:hypothetical protein n=1 Tax=Nocardia sp. JMUB6875 TaxID=3158170 RepID=UPI0032E75A1A
MCAEWDFTTDGLKAAEAAENMSPADFGGKSPTADARFQMFKTRELTNATRLAMCDRFRDYWKLVDKLRMQYSEGHPVKPEYRDEAMFQQLPAEKNAAYARAACQDLPRVKQAGGPAKDTDLFAEVWAACVDAKLISK